MTTEPNQAGSLVDLVALKRRQVGQVLLALGAILVAMTIYWAMTANQPHQDAEAKVSDQKAPEQGAPPAKSASPLGDNNDYALAAVWSALLASLFIVSGAVLIVRIPEPGRERFEARLGIVALGGTIGIVTALFGFALAWRWQDNLLQWINEGKTREARWVVAALAVFLGGLAIMFISMMPARTEERSSATLRRMLYGSNAILSGLLVLLALVVVNVVVFLKLPDSVITTAAAYKGLSDPGKEYLPTITDDVYIYLIMPENFTPDIDGERYSGLYADCRALLNAATDANPRFKVKYLSPATDSDEIRRTMKRLKVREQDYEQLGMLIGYGTGEALSSFISWRELVTFTREGMPLFQGESRMLTELLHLSGGGKTPVVYFTQSNAEPSIGADGPGNVSLRKASLLIQHLKDRKYEVKPLVFEPGKKPDLSDATMVVIGAPRVPFTPEQVSILREYMRPKKDGAPGKLIAMLPAFPKENGEVSSTGLEAFLSEFGVDEVGNQRLFTLPMRDLPTGSVRGTISPDCRRIGHPLARLMARDGSLSFGNVRPISMREKVPGSQALGFDLFVTVQCITYRDSRYDSDAVELLALLEKETPENQRKIALEKQIRQGLVPFAAVLSDRVNEGGAVKEQTRLLVVGTDSFIADEFLRQSPRAEEYVSMAGEMFDWMRERPNVSVEPRALGTFSLPEKPDGFALLYFPVGMLMLGIIALGAGVWVARRS